MLDEILAVARAMFVRQIIMMQRYLLNTLSGMVTVYIVFLLLFLGARAVTSPVAGGDTLEGFVVGYTVWMFATFAFSDLAWGLTNEAQMGTLEKLYLSPVGFKWVSIFHQLSTMVLQWVTLGLVMLLIMNTTGIRLQLDLISIVPLMLITMTAAYGFGFMAGGLALVHKRIQSAFQILQFIFIAFIMARGPLAVYLPLNAGNQLLYQVMVNGRRVWELPPGRLLLAVVTGAVYLVLGLVVFGRMERVARERGLLGHY